MCIALPLTTTTTTSTIEKNKKYCTKTVSPLIRMKEKKKTILFTQQWHNREFFSQTPLRYSSHHAHWYAYQMSTCVLPTYLTIHTHTISPKTQRPRCAVAATTKRTERYESNMR